MVVFLSILTNFVFFCFGYLIGSLNTSIIIGKLFYKVDIRTFHSGNAGSTNAERVFWFKNIIYNFNNRYIQKYLKCCYSIFYSKIY
ncbi:glycerol-3-phosphate acyltransferase [Mycoplasmopsis felis]|uniref:glycerol-3-phosphate acyltransferase n=1 Tax=Mycoplasmopsis felis TaxID=33923 RepID=UPI003A5C8027